MIDNKGSEDDFQDSFGEDFELQDETSSETPAVEKETTSSSLASKISKQNLIAIVSVVVVLIGGFFGYRYFSHYSANKQRSASSVQTKMPNQARTTLFAAPKTTTPPQTSMANKTPTTKELTENEIAQAFSTADKSPTQTDAEVQKGLFGKQEKGDRSHNQIAGTPSSKETGEAHSELSQQLNQLNQVLDKLNQQMETNLNQIKYLDSYTQEISKTMNKINESITAMDHRLLAVTNTTQNLSNEVGTVRSEVGQVKQVLGEDVLDLPPGPTKTPCLDKKCKVEETEFVVHAAIPGRVWLKSTKGQILTLTEGEVLGNYGKILVIDAVNGVVLTSSGVTFR